MSIQNHKLAWRWTDAAYTVLPDAVLAQMHPLFCAKAQALHTQSLAFLGKDGLSTELNSEVLNTEKLLQEEAAQWLIQHQPDMDLAVLLSWGADTALKTTWRIFISYWPDFCYPASDDLVVLPESAQWVLFYDHQQNFHFAGPVARCGGWR